MTKKKTDFVVRPSRLGACIKLAGDPNAGILLYRILLRTEMKTMKARDGTDGWTVLSRGEWMTDTGLTRHQHDRALSILKKQELVECMHAKRTKREQYQRTWLRLPTSTASAVADIMQAQAISATADKPIASLSAIADKSLSSFSAKPDDTKVNDKKEENGINGNVFLSKEKQKPVSEKKSKEDPGKKEEFTKLMKEVCAGANGILPEAYKPKNHKWLLEILQYIEENSHEFEGMCKSGQKPSLWALNTVYRRWGEFIKFAKDAHKAYNEPGEPALWFAWQQQKAVADFARLVAYVAKRGDAAAGTPMTDYQDDFTGYKKMSAEEKQYHLAGFEKPTLSTGVEDNAFGKGWSFVEEKHKFYAHKMVKNYSGLNKALHDNGVNTGSDILDTLHLHWEELVTLEKTGILPKMQASSGMLPVSGLFNDDKLMQKITGFLTFSLRYKRIAELYAQTYNIHKADAEKLCHDLPLKYQRLLDADTSVRGWYLGPQFECSPDCLNSWYELFFPAVVKSKLG